ncbi:hypothetical protein CCAX7_009380 [Capsulimonas corticalis]|uniref:Spore protein YkvP/CgeB glycosyl transferase-like domain-containing protein n=1 Tax=Capsulimonas corticalis TaxID=2219043 RepID=A0A402CU98_9BACT|nr:glycosyltransferase [Capsulimonas corticalis]BDI28887.1 hypothetical protein CCAX7_009380 [Capsulimonas corticalis]
MRVAIQNPNLALDQSRNFNGYDFEFLRQFKPIIYVPDLRGVPRRYKALLQLGWKPQEIRFAVGPRQLNHMADVLVCFAGTPYDLRNKPPRDFHGLKVFHVMDYVFRAEESHQILADSGVQYVMGYTDHGKYCPFFQKYYPSFCGKVISVPFGYGARFENKLPYADRTPKVIALGSVNPVDDPAVPDRAMLKEYIDFYANVRWTHQWRRILAENEENLANIMDSQLPHFPETKNPDYDAVAMMNQYRMFANDEGLMEFPPARTFEGTAAGCVMVSSDHASYGDYGFLDGVNCVMHRRHDLSDFQEKVRYYIDHPDKLAQISQNSTEMVRTRYSHPQIASDLHEHLRELWGASTTS